GGEAGGGGAGGRGHHFSQSGERALMLRVVLGGRPGHRRFGGETRAQVRERHLPRLGEEVPVEGSGGGVPRGEEIGQAEDRLEGGGRGGGIVHRGGGHDVRGPGGGRGC